MPTQEILVKADGSVHEMGAYNFMLVLNNNKPLRRKNGAIQGYYTQQSAVSAARTAAQNMKRDIRIKPYVNTPDTSEVNGPQVTVQGELLTEEEFLTNETSYERTLSYVQSLKGKALTEALKFHGLSIGSDPVASKSERLIAHLVRTTH